MSAWSVQRRIAVAFAVAAVLVVAAVVAAALVLAGAREAQQRVVNDYYEATSVSHDAFLEVVDIEVGVLDYLRTGDPAELQPLADAQGSDRGERLRALLADDEVSLAAFEDAADVARSWFEDAAAPAIAQVQAGGPEALTAAEVEEVDRRFVDVRAAYDEYVDVLADQRDGAVNRLLRRMNALFGAVVVAAVVAGAAAVFLWLALRRWVMRPLGELAAQTRLVHDGALDHPVVVAGPPEVERLGSDVDEMRRGLVAQIQAARTAGRELEVAKARLEERTADLERSNRELEQFAYVASHDLQEPLRKVASFCQLLQKRYGGQLDERADQYIEFAVDGAKRMQRLINDLLEFSRVGRLTAPQTDVDLGACLDGALQDLQLALEESGAVVTRDPLPVVRGEAPLLKQLFVNLVGNAVKFRSQEPPRVHVGAGRVGEFWEMCCSDNGIGIEQQYAERVFVIFQRLHPKDVYGGTGIGLAVCKKIVEYHGGTIWVDPRGDDDRGTTIRWRLPAEPAPAGTHEDDHDAVPVAAGAAGESNGSGGPHVG